MKREISVREYQISRGQKIWTEHRLPRRFEAMAQYLVNLALEWNLKYGGVNQQIPCNKMGILSSSKTMVAGKDVTHPSPESRENTFSVAGVVASIGEKCGKWHASSPKRLLSGRRMDGGSWLAWKPHRYRNDRAPGGSA